MVEKLVVYPDAMRRNFDSLGGLVFSQHVLLELTQAGMSREDAYAKVQTAAMAVWEKGGSFRTQLERDPDIAAAVPPTRLDELFDADRQLVHVDTIFERVFGS